MQNIYNSKWFGWVLGAIGVLILLLVVFRLGMYVGERRESLDTQWGENYGRLFGEPKPGFFPGRSANPVDMNAFGNGGIVLTVDGDSLTIKGNDGNEKSILTDNSTVIREMKQDITLKDIKSGDMVVILGEPNNSGQILAKFIRVFTPPFSAQPNSSSTNQ